MFSLTVDQEVIELRDGQSQHTQRWILHSSAIGHDASSCDGVWNLLLVVSHLLTCADKKAQVRTVASQEICEEIRFVKPPYFLSVTKKNKKSFLLFTHAHRDPAAILWVCHQSSVWCRVGQSQDPSDYKARHKCRTVPSDPYDCECWTHNGTFSSIIQIQNTSIFGRKGVFYLKDLKSSTNSTKLMMLSEIMRSWKPLKQPFPRPCQLRLLQALKTPNIGIS